MLACHDLTAGVFFVPFLLFQAMNIQKIEVIKRDELGRGHSRRLRKSGRIPIVFYGKGRNERFSLAEPDFRNIEKSSGTSLVELEPDGGEISLALIKEVQRDPCTDNILHIDPQAWYIEALSHGALPLIMLIVNSSVIRLKFIWINFFRIN